MRSSVVFTYCIYAPTATILVFHTLNNLHYLPPLKKKKAVCTAALGCPSPPHRSPEVSAGHRAAAAAVGNSLLLFVSCTGPLPASRGGPLRDGAESFSSFLFVTRK